MATLHAAELKPTKLELINAWLPHQSWYRGSAGDTPSFAQVGSFRFDDPAGEVGLQVLLVRDENGGDNAPIYQVPMTYRDAPLPEAAAGFMGEMAHSVLGTRHVYDACHDRVFIGELVRAMFTGGTQVAEFRHADGQEPVTMPATMHVRGSGDASADVPELGPLTVAALGDHGQLAIIGVGAVEITVPRVLDGSVMASGPASLSGEWGDGESACLAVVR